MLPTWAELLAGKTPAQVLDELLAGLKGRTPPFPVDDWNEGAVPLVVLDAVSRVFSRAYASATSIARGGFLYLALDDWLPLLVRNKYMLTQNPAAFTQGVVVFSCAPTAGPYTITGGQYTVSTIGGLKYTNTNTAPLVLPAGGSVNVPVKAQSPGAAWNVAAGQISRLNVSLPGVTISNTPTIDLNNDGLPDTWISLYGSDIESPAELRARAAARLGRLSRLQNAPEDAYISAARDADPVVKRVVVFTNFLQSLAVPGAVTLFLAGDAGPVAPAVTQNVFDKLNPYRCPLGTIAVESCRLFPMPLFGVVEVNSRANIPASQDEVITNLNTYQRESDPGGFIFGAEIIERVMSASNVVNFRPAGLFDKRLAANEVVGFQYTGLQFVARTRGT